MSVKIKMSIDPKRIVAGRNLLGAQRAFTHMVRQNCDTYVPMDSGVLKNSAEEYTDRIEYITPYAAKQYYENRGKGQRGPYWDRRMKAQKNDEMLRKVAILVGGKVKW